MGRGRTVRVNAKSAALLLTLDAEDCFVLRDALNLYAAATHSRADSPASEDHGRANALADRLSELISLAMLDADQMMRHLGIGRSAGRRQG